MNCDFIRFEFTPIIIIGAPRSGTNMLRDTLTTCKGAQTWACDEINAIWRHYNARLPSDELHPSQATGSVKRYVRTVFQRLAHRTKAQWIVEKTCANSLRIDFVRAILPEARFVFLVRGGYDAVASGIKRWTAPFDLRYTLRKARYVPPGDAALFAARFVANRLHQIRGRDRRLSSWGPRFDGMQKMLRERSLGEVCAEQWSRCVRSSAAALASCPVDQVCFVRYEGFVSDPQREILRIAEFAGMTISAGQLGRIASAISPASVGKGLNEFDADTLSRIGPLIEKTMSSLESWDRPMATGSNCTFAA